MPRAAMENVNVSKGTKATDFSVKVEKLNIFFYDVHESSKKTLLQPAIRQNKWQNTLQETSSWKSKYCFKLLLFLLESLVYMKVVF